VVECFATGASGFHVDAQVFFDLALADVLVDSRRAQSQVQLAIFVGRSAVS
jgi:hypothetical protein